MVVLGAGGVVLGAGAVREICVRMALCKGAGLVSRRVAMREMALVRGPSSCFLVKSEALRRQ